MNIVIDIGNSSAKVGCFGSGPAAATFRRVRHAELLPIVESLRPAHVLLSSVTDQAETWRTALAPAARQVWVLDHRLPLPFANHYQTPHTLGTDRLAAVAGAQALYPGCSCLVLDAGTCLKYEWFENGTDYRGGAISPGLQMRFQALNAFTSRLPLLQPAAEAPLTGTTTDEALQSGVLNGMQAEMEGMLDRYRRQSPGLTALLTGGDAHFFERRLKTPIFVVPELVVVGLNHILTHILAQSGG